MQTTTGKSFSNKMQAYSSHRTNLEMISGVSLRQQKEALEKAGILNLGGSKENVKTYM